METAAGDPELGRLFEWTFEQRLVSMSDMTTTSVRQRAMINPMMTPAGRSVRVEGVAGMTGVFRSSTVIGSVSGPQPTRVLACIRTKCGTSTVRLRNWARYFVPGSSWMAHSSMGA